MNVRERKIIMHKEITLKDFIDYLSSHVGDYDKSLKGIGCSSDGFYTIHIDDGYVQKIIRVPEYKN